MRGPELCQFTNVKGSSDVLLLVDDVCCNSSEGSETVSKVCVPGQGQDDCVTGRGERTLLGFRQRPLTGTSLKSLSNCVMGSRFA